MKPHRCWSLGLAILAFGVAPAMGADEAPVREFVAAYVSAFNEKNIESITAMWAEDAVHTDRETGQRTEGREAITGDISTTFKSSSPVRLAGQVERVRFITDNVASVEGQTTTAADGEEPSVSSFTAIVVKGDNGWQIKSIDEMPVPTASSSQQALQQLDWLIGEWVDEGEGTKVETNIRFTPSNAFLLRSFAVTSESGDSRQGTQIIGWDPRSGDIRSWTFNSDGSFGDGTWSRTSDGWLIKSAQTLADGRAASGTYVLTRVDDDTVTLQLIGHAIEGEPQPSSSPVTMVRKSKADVTEKAAAAPKSTKQQ